MVRGAMVRGAVVRGAVVRGTISQRIVIVLVVLLLLFLLLVASEHICSNGTADSTETAVSKLVAQRSSGYTTEKCFTEAAFAFYGLSVGA